MLSAGMYDLLILDIDKSHTDKMQIARETRETTTGLPIIFTTNQATVETAVAAIQLGASAYLVKPIDPDMMFLHIHQSVTRNRLRRTITDMRSSVAWWDRTAGALQNILENPLDGNVADFTGPMLATTFDNIVNSVTDLRRVLGCLIAEDHLLPPTKSMALLGKLEISRVAVRETIAALEETKHAFKSKRLGDLRRQLQGLQGILEQE
jgi:CheY-like chemotaxis protein